MVDLLRRSHAPVTEEAWREIDGLAQRILKSQLSARSVVGLDGPHGWDLASVNLGRLEVAEKPGPHGVPWGVRKVLPLLEVRIPFFPLAAPATAERGCAAGWASQGWRNAR